MDDDEVAAVQEETSTRPCMSHLLHSGPDLDARYPPLIAPPDEGLVDATDDRRDAVYQHGLGIAEDIRAQVAAQGRKRRPGLNQARSKEEGALSVVEELVEDPRELDWLKHGARDDLTWLKPSTLGLASERWITDATPFSFSISGWITDATPAPCQGVVAERVAAYTSCAGVTGPPG